MMTTAQCAKLAGFKHLNEVAEIIGKTTEALRFWHKHNYKLFEVILYGAGVKKFGHGVWVFNKGE